MEDDNARHIVRVYVGALSQEYEALSVEASKHTTGKVAQNFIIFEMKRSNYKNITYISYIFLITAEEIVTCIVQKLGFNAASEYELAEVIENSTGQECKERRIGNHESPVRLKLLWVS